MIHNFLFYCMYCDPCPRLTYIYTINMYIGTTWGVCATWHRPSSRSCRCPSCNRSCWGLEAMMLRFGVRLSGSLKRWGVRPILGLPSSRCVQVCLVSVSQQELIISFCILHRECWKLSTTFSTGARKGCTKEQLDLSAAWATSQ